MCVYSVARFPGPGSSVQPAQLLVPPFAVFARARPAFPPEPDAQLGLGRSEYHLLETLEGPVEVERVDKVSSGGLERILGETAHVRFGRLLVVLFGSLAAMEVCEEEVVEVREYRQEGFDLVRRDLLR